MGRISNLIPKEYLVIAIVFFLLGVALYLVYDFTRPEPVTYLRFEPRDGRPVQRLTCDDLAGRLPSHKNCGGKV